MEGDKIQSACGACGEPLEYDIHLDGQVMSCAHCLANLTLHPRVCTVAPPAVQAFNKKTRTKVTFGGVILMLVAFCFIVPSILSIVGAVLAVNHDGGLDGKTKSNAIGTLMGGIFFSVLGAYLFETGRKLNRQAICGNCGNDLGDSAVMCTACRAQLK
jgi:hypothetical protein